MPNMRSASRSVMEWSNPLALKRDLKYRRWDAWPSCVVRELDSCCWIRRLFKVANIWGLSRRYRPTVLDTAFTVNAATVKPTPMITGRTIEGV